MISNSSDDNAALEKTNLRSAVEKVLKRSMSTSDAVGCSGLGIGAGVAGSLDDSATGAGAGVGVETSGAGSGLAFSFVVSRGRTAETGGLGYAALVAREAVRLICGALEAHETVDGNAGTSDSSVGVSRGVRTSCLAGV